MQDALVGLGCRIQLVFGFLYLTQADCSRHVNDDIAGCLADSNGFAIGPAGRATVSLELVSNPQLPDSGSADRQVIGVQILQSAVRLGNDGFHLVLSDSHQGPYGGNMPDEVAGLVVCLGTLQGCFGRLQFRFDARKKAGHR